MGSVNWYNNVSGRKGNILVGTFKIQKKVKSQLKEMTKPKSLLLPPPLQPGDLLQVIAPSGAVRQPERLEKGVEIWRSRGYRVELATDCNACYGYLAGTDAQRRQALAQAWQDRECKAILCARGGYGSARLLEEWDWGGVGIVGSVGSVGSLGSVGRQAGEKLLDSAKWLIGFSDITGLLWSLAKVGVASVHGPVLTTLAKEPEWSINRLFDLVEGRSLESLMGKGWGGGKTKGMLLPANLTVATHLLGTSIQPSFDGVILALEEVGEAPYRIDRMLTQWRMSGAFKGVKGIAFGRFSGCSSSPGISSWSVEEVLRDRLGDLNIPIVSDLSFGHDGANAALPVGQIAHLDGDEGVLTVQMFDS